MLHKYFSTFLIGISFWLSALIVPEVQAQQNTLTLWCWGLGFNHESVDMAIKRYQQSHPDVEFEVKNFDNMKLMNTFNLIMESHNVKALPDIMLIEDRWIHNYLSRFPDVFFDFTGKIDPHRFTEHALYSSRYQGKQYGIPFDSGIAGLFVRQDLFYKVGFNEADFMYLTWDRFIEMGRKVKKATGIALLSYNPSQLGFVHALMKAYGSWYIQGDRVHISNNVVLRNIFLLLKKLDREGLLISVQNYPHYIRSFHEHKIASGIIGSWFIPSLANGSDKGELWHLYNLPHFRKSQKPAQYTTLGASQWYANAYSPRVHEATDFLLKTFASDNGLLNDIRCKFNFISSLRDPSQLNNYNTYSELFDGQDVEGILSYWNTQIPIVDYGKWNYQLDILLNEALQRVLGGENIEAVLEETQFQAEQIIDFQRADTVSFQ